MNRMLSFRHPLPRRGWARAFTLVEILVSITILLIIMVVMFQLTATLAGIWTSSKGKISSFENARLAFSTLNATLGRATLNTYIDYRNKTGAVRTYRNTTNASTFIPNEFGRASELHFLSGPATDVLVPLYDPTNAYQPTPPVPKASTNPGHAIFFQAPLGTTKLANFTGMNRVLNSVGIYIQYCEAPAGLSPTWLNDWLTANNKPKDYHFRLVQYVEPSENLRTYYSTSLPKYDSGWINFGSIVTTSAPPTDLTKPRARVLADDVLLLIIRPRLSQADEASAAVKPLGLPYVPARDLGSALCPNYQYDSRAWAPNYPPGGRVNAAAGAPDRAFLMCNQVPPIIDVAMVCADPQSLVRFGFGSATPPTGLPVADPNLLFKNSAKMDADLDTFAQQLSTAKIHFHIMRSSVQIESARWSNN